MSLRFHRYLAASDFVRQLSDLQAYPHEYLDTRLLEELEELRLVLPRWRLRYPDTVARRFWLSNDRSAHMLRQKIEPDGPRWDVALELKNALSRWRNHTVYGTSPHPFDAPVPRFTQFLQQPATLPFQAWRDMRVDVSNDIQHELFADIGVESYYSVWQILLAAEVADIGVHFRINLADERVRDAADQAIREGRAPGGTASFVLGPVRSIGDFNKHERALDAVVWFAEETDRALAELVKGESGRFHLDEAQSTSYTQARRQAAEFSSSRYQSAVGDLIGACRFLASRWSYWDRHGRPLVANAYKDYLAQAVLMTLVLGDLSFIEIRDQVGRQGGWFKPILEVIWPDWREGEKERARRTLKARISESGTSEVEHADVDAFVEFLDEEHIEAFFWRLRSFEEHVFGGNEFALEGMKSDIQGMAVVVEHIARCLGGTREQLYEMFKELWADPSVLDLLKRDDVARLARQERLAQDWSVLKSRIKALCSDGRAGRIAADLVIAHRIRGGVHHTLPEDDQFEMEKLFVTLMRAAALVFVEARRTGRVRRRTARSNAVTSGAT